jgi:hypothetical protein
MPVSPSAALVPLLILANSLALTACGGDDTNQVPSNGKPVASGKPAASATSKPPVGSIQASDTGSPPPFTPPQYAADHATFEVEWSDDARVIEEADGKELLLGEPPDASTLTYLFASSAALVANLEPGNIAVLAGVAYRRVVSVTETDAGIELVTERTTLPEAIASGTIDWAKTVDFGDPKTLKSLQLSYGGLPLKRLNQLELPGPVSYEGDLEGDYHVNITLTPGSGLELSVIVTKEVLGENRFGLEATGTIHGFQSEGRWVGGGGEGLEFEQGNRNVAGDIHLQATAFNTGASQELLNLPIGVDIPIQVGPVPLLLKLKVAVNVTLELNVIDSSAQAEVELHFQSDTGISVTGSSLTPNATLGSSDVRGFAGGSADAVAAGMTACVEAPRLELSMLGEFASVGITQNNCASTFFTFTPACNSVRGSITGLALASLGFFGFTLAEGQVELYKYDDDLTLGGAVCED